MVSEKKSLKDEFDFEWITNYRLVQDMKKISKEAHLLLGDSTDYSFVEVLVSADFPGKLFTRKMKDYGHLAKLFYTQTGTYKTDRSAGELEWLKPLSPVEQIELVMRMAQGIPTILFDDLVHEGTTYVEVMHHLMTLKMQEFREINTEQFMHEYNLQKRNLAHGFKGINAERFENAKKVLGRYVNMKTEEIIGETFFGVAYARHDFTDHGNSLDSLAFYGDFFEMPKSGKKLWLAFEYKPETWEPLLSDEELMFDAQLHAPWLKPYLPSRLQREDY